MAKRVRAGQGEPLVYRSQPRLSNGTKDGLPCVAGRELAVPMPRRGARKQRARDGVCCEAGGRRNLIPQRVLALRRLNQKILPSAAGRGPAVAKAAAIQAGRMRAEIP